MSLQKTVGLFRRAHAAQNAMQADPANLTATAPLFAAAATPPFAGGAPRLDPGAHGNTQQPLEQSVAQGLWNAHQLTPGAKIGHADPASALGANSVAHAALGQSVTGRGAAPPGWRAPGLPTADEIDARKQPLPSLFRR